VRKANPAKVRVKLPPIESYEKELEFSAEGPGRVVVRLERLMGTDRVRILDAKYMRTLLERLEGEEKKSWTKRTRQRKNDEKNRYRQLAIEGHMEPDADMQDLYNHPVFRVNRILNRLAKLDMDMGATVTLKLPPMTPCEPLVDGDENGEIFKTYPGHRPVQKSKKRKPRKTRKNRRRRSHRTSVIKRNTTSLKGPFRKRRKRKTRIGAMRIIPKGGKNLDLKLQIVTTRGRGPRWTTSKDCTEWLTTKNSRASGNRTIPDSSISCTWMNRNNRGQCTRFRRPFWGFTSVKTWWRMISSQSRSKFANKMLLWIPAVVNHNAFAYYELLAWLRVLAHSLKIKMLQVVVCLLLLLLLLLLFIHGKKGQVCMQRSDSDARERPADTN